MAELGFIGAGNMATALAAGVVKAGLCKAGAIIAADPDQGRRAAFEQAVGAGVKLTEDNRAVVAGAKTIFLCTKPQIVGDALKPLAGVFTSGHLIVTILAGTDAATVHKLAGGKAAVVRVMPNTPMLIGLGAAGLCAGPGATAEHLAATRRYLESSAKVIDVAPELMNAVTALSGSGPAYLFYLAEAMIAAGIEMGLTPAQSRTLTVQTLIGASQMIDTTGRPPEALRAQVTSPKGTTQAAVEVLEARSVQSAIQAAIVRARDRGVELSQPMKDNH
ncbi:MAG TPA: pyrroline-5-carboxylate reductase [Planctomycetota bacterium]|nr:pyrroline-5-carboxylate reductase [Planctomycetota bacterium]